MRLAIASVLVLLSTGCRSNAIQSQPVAPVFVQPVVTENPAPSVAAGASRHGYAATPLTPLADRLTDLVLAAVRGQPLPDVGIPLESMDPSRPLVSYREGEAPPPQDLTPFGFGLEIEVALPTGQGSSGTNMAFLPYLGSTGLRLTAIRIHTFEAQPPLPPALAGVGETVDLFLSALAAGTAGGMLLGEADRQALGNDQFFQMMLEDAPDPAELAAVGETLRTSGRPSGFEIDDIIILARGSDSSIWSLSMNGDEGPDGQFVIDSRPLVSVRRFDEE